MSPHVCVKEERDDRSRSRVEDKVSLCVFSNEREIKIQLTPSLTSYLCLQSWEVAPASAFTLDIFAVALFSFAAVLEPSPLLSDLSNAGFSYAYAVQL
jgi:hypothetical protein